jgi:micrococcal nuclease
MVRKAPDVRLGRRLFDVALGAAFGAGVTALFVGLKPAPERDAAARSPEARLETPLASRSYEGRALAVIDGDTLEARVTAFPGQEVVARVRIDGVDAPERRGRCDAETEAAAAAARALERLVDGRRLEFAAVRGDKYFGRVVARVSVAGIGDLGEALVAAGHGRAYAGGSRGGWCG